MDAAAIGAAGTAISAIILAVGSLLPKARIGSRRTRKELSMALDLLHEFRLVLSHAGIELPHRVRDLDDELQRLREGDREAGS